MAHWFQKWKTGVYSDSPSGQDAEKERTKYSVVTEMMPNPLSVDIKSMFIRPICAVAFWAT